MISIGSLEESLDDFERVWADGRAVPPRINFVSYELMHKVLAPKRLEIIRAMTGAGPLGIREIARLVHRDFKGVHTDVAMLRRNGIIDKTADGKLVFPYDGIHFDFRLPLPILTAA